MFLASQFCLDLADKTAGDCLIVIREVIREIKVLLKCVSLVGLGEFFVSG